MRLAHEVFGKRVLLEVGSVAGPYSLLTKVSATPDAITVRPAGAGDPIFGVHHWPGEVLSAPGRGPAAVHVGVGGTTPVRVGAEPVRAGDWLAADDNGAAVASATPTPIRAREAAPAGSRALAELFS